MRALAVLLLLFVATGPAFAQQARGYLDVIVGPVTGEDAGVMGRAATRGAKIKKVTPGGPAAIAGLQAEDIVISFDDVDVEDDREFLAAIKRKAAGTEVTIVVLRRGRERHIVATLGAAPSEPERAEVKKTPSGALRSDASSTLPPSGGVRSEASSPVVLQLDTGGHQASIHGLAFTPDGNFTISAGDDKIIRIWDWRAGKTVRTIRGSSGTGPEGQIYALALSPDGHWLAASGFFPGNREENDAIRLYDFDTGELAALLMGHARPVTSLAFSGDGKKLISAAGPDAMVWDIGVASTQGAETKASLSQLKGHRDAIQAVGFMPDGKRAVTASHDHTLRLWRVADGSLEKELKGHETKVQTLAVSPRDGSIVSSDLNGEIRLWDGNSGAFVKVFARLGGPAGALKFSPSGRLLLFACGDSACKQTQRVFDVASGKEVSSYSKHDNIVSAAAFAPGEEIVATGGGNNHEIHIWDPKTGNGKAVLKGSGRPIWAAAFSSDSRNIAWGHSAGRTWSPNNYGPLERYLSLPASGEALSQPEPLSGQSGWIQAQTVSGALSVKVKTQGQYDAFLDIFKGGKPAGVTLQRRNDDGFTHRSYSFTPDGGTIISGGGSGKLIAYSTDGKKIGEFAGHESDVWAVAPSRDGRFLVSGSADETVKLWNLKTRELIVTIFQGADGEWAIWTPQGYYAASPAASELLGWQINRGTDKTADFITAGQLRQRLNRPSVVAKAIELGSAEDAVRGAHGTEFKLTDLVTRAVPHLRILSPASPLLAKTSGEAAVKIALDATPDPVIRLRIQVNGRQLDDVLPGSGRATFPAGEQTIKVPLALGKNVIAITAQNAVGWSREEDATLRITSEGPGMLDRRGTLYILAIGAASNPALSDRCKPEPNCGLAYAPEDAEAFAASMDRSLGPSHGWVARRILITGKRKEDEPTAANISEALSAFSRTQPNDTVAVFIAGQGINEGQNYFFVPADAPPARNGPAPESALPWRVIEDAIANAKGRRLLFLDVNHSPGAYNPAFGAEAYYANVVVYSAARWNQQGRDIRAFGHGVFTQALIEGLSGAPEAKKSGRSGALQLREYLQRRIPELAKEIRQIQQPEFVNRLDEEGFPPGSVN
jgi:WD40 repeat protein